MGSKPWKLGEIYGCNLYASATYMQRYTVRPTHSDLHGLSLRLHEIPIQLTPCAIYPILYGHPLLLQILLMIWHAGGDVKSTKLTNQLLSVLVYWEAS